MIRRNYRVPKQYQFYLFCLRRVKEICFKNYRPISLTNTDYKIIAFLFAKRLQNVLSSISNGNQMAYVKERYIGETLG